MVLCGCDASTSSGRCVVYVPHIRDMILPLRRSTFPQCFVNILNHLIRLAIHGGLNSHQRKPCAFEGRNAAKTVTQQGSQHEKESLGIVQFDGVMASCSFIPVLHCAEDMAFFMFRNKTEGRW
jgi:hypothetical protein